MPISGTMESMELWKGQRRWEEKKTCYWTKAYTSPVVLLVLQTQNHSTQGKKSPNAPLSGLDEQTLF